MNCLQDMHGGWGGGGVGGGQSGAQHVPVLSLPKCGPAKLVSKRSTGC